MKYIERYRYIQKLVEYRKTCRIVILTGLQGAGKTSLLANTARELRNEKPPIRIVQTGHDNGIENRTELLAEAHSLGAGNSALLIDDADSIEGLAEALSEIIQNYKTTVFITGRNTARLESILEKAFGPTARGILGTIRVNPFTYTEFLDATGLPENYTALSLYCKTGGLPQSLMVDPQGDDSREFTRLRANSFLLTEIVEPRSLRNPGHLREILSIVSHSPGESLSARQICQAFEAERITISPQAVLDYLEYCATSSLLVPVSVLDIDKKKIIDAGDVWYFGDAGLRAAFVKRETPAELSRAEENAIFLRLIDDGWTVFHGRVGYGRSLKEEISFVCERNGKRIYLQLIPNTATSGERLRKRKALLAIRDAWPRYLVDSDSGEDEADGIRRLDTREILIGGIGG